MDTWYVTHYTIKLTIRDQDYSSNMIIEEIKMEEAGVKYL